MLASSAGSVYAQRNLGSSTNNAYAYGGYYQGEAPVPDAPPTASPSDEAMAEDEAAPAASNGSANGCATCDSCGDACGCGDACACEAEGDDCCKCYCFGPDEPATLFCNEGPVKVGFWSQVGYYTEGANGVGDGLFNTLPNDVQINQQWVWIEKAVEAGPCCWDWGYRFDYVYGTDGPDTQAFGGREDDWDNDWDHGATYGHAIPQLYAELGYGDWKFKLGHFFTIIGYEVVPATGNFFYSHAYEMYKSEPFTHSGVLATYAYNDNVTFYGGWTAGWDTGFSRNGGDIFLGGITMKLAEDLTLAYATTIGDFGFGDDASDSNGYMQSIVITADLSENWQYIFQTDYLDNDLFVGGDGKNYGVNQYLFYTVNDCWKWGTRVEWFRNGGDEMGQVTFGANYHPSANIVFRPEVRFDYFEDGLDVFDTGDETQDSTMFAMDMIITY
jgi:hypothetical protein